MGHKLSYDSLAQVRCRLVQVNPVFGQVNQNPAPAAWGSFGAAGQVAATAFVGPIKNFYMTDPISRASETMARCMTAFANGTKTGTHG
jgi:NADH-quinone oxidoreductase subunit G